MADTTSLSALPQNNNVQSSENITLQTNDIVQSQQQSQQPQYQTTITTTTTTDAINATRNLQILNKKPLLRTLYQIHNKLPIHLNNYHKM